MNVRLRYELPFTAGIYHDGSFYMNNYNLRLLMATVSEDPNDQTTAFDRLKHFVYSCMESTIFINADETEQHNRFIQAGLDITTMPGEPVDQLIGIMLYHKLNAVMENRMIVFETEISSAAGEYMTYLHSEDEDLVGLVQPEWWTTPDLIHSDIVPVESEKIVSMPSGTSWRDLEMDWDLSTDEPVANETGNIVVFADFKQPNETK